VDVSAKKLLFAGTSAIKAKTDNTASTTAYVGKDSKIDLSAQQGNLVIKAEHIATFNEKVGVVSGGILAATGAEVDHDANSIVTAGIGDRVISKSGTVILEAINRSNKVNLGFPNIDVITAGVLVGAGAKANITLDFTTEANIGIGADINASKQADSLTLTALNDITLIENIQLTAAGLGAKPGATIVINTPTLHAGVNIGVGALVFTEGNLAVSARGKGDIDSKVAVRALGAVVLTDANSIVDITPTNTVSFEGNSKVTAIGDANISAGTDTNFNNDHYKLHSLIDSLSAAVVPIDSSVSRANFTVTNTINVNAGALVATAKQLNLHTDRDGFIDFATVNKTLSWVSTVAGTADLGGEGETKADGEVIINGTVKTGIRRNQELEINALSRTEGSAPLSQGEVRTSNDGSAENLDFLTQDDVAGVSKYIATDGVTIDSTSKLVSSPLFEDLADARKKALLYSTNSDLAAHYQGEVLRLKTELQALGLMVDGQAIEQYAFVIIVNPVHAEAGRVDVRSGSLVGNGEIIARGDASVKITNYTAAFLEIQGINIDTSRGGLFYNGNHVNHVIKALSNLRLNVGGGNTDDPEINVINGDTTSVAKPDINIVGDVTNRNGAANFITSGNIISSGKLDVKSQNIKAGGAFVINKSGSTDGDVENKWNDKIGKNGLKKATAANIENLIKRTPGPPTLYGSSITINAEYININGVIQSGRDQYNLYLGKDVEADIDKLKSSNTGRVLLSRVSNLDFDVYYDVSEQQIVVSLIEVNGGKIELNGRILSSVEDAEIRLLGGYGEVLVKNDTRFDIKMEGVDASKRGPGILSINDKSFLNKPMPVIYKKDASGVSIISDKKSPDPDKMYYNPKEGWRYAWSVGQEILEKTNYTVAEATWAGINGFAADPDTLVNTDTNTVTEPTLQDEENHFKYDDKEITKDYIYKPGGKSDLLRNYKLVSSVVTSDGLDTTYTRKFVTQILKADIPTHSVRADYPIKIQFLGKDEAKVSITSPKGDVILAGAISNSAGKTIINSGASILSDARGIVGGHTIKLTAAGNIGVTAGAAIGSSATALAVDAGTSLSFHSGGDTNITTESPLILAQGITVDGDILLTSVDNSSGSSGNNDVTILSGGTIRSVGGSITINAGDNFTLKKGASLATEKTQNGNETKIEINGDSGSTDPEGSVITVNGRLISASTITLRGGADSDVFELDAEAYIGNVNVLGGAGNDNIHLNRLHSRSESLSIDGEDGDDTTVIDRTGANADYVVSVTDTGLTVDADQLIINGLASSDTFLVREYFVALLHGSSTSGFTDNKVERINYDGSINSRLTLNGLGDNDSFFSDDNSTITTLDGGAGDDRFQIGQLFGADRTSPFVAQGDEIETTETTLGLLSGGNSLPMVVYGGDGEDTFTVYANSALIKLYGDDGNDNFVVRAFLKKDTAEVAGGTDTELFAGSGDDNIEYTINTPLAIDGGADDDTIVVLGTAANDSVVTTADGILGAGLNIQYIGLEAVEIDDLAGDDSFFVLSTKAGVVTTIIGGLGSDTFDVGGNVTRDIIAYSLEGRSGVINHSVFSDDQLSKGISAQGISLKVVGDDNGVVRINNVDGSSNGSAAGLTDSYEVSITAAVPSTATLAHVTVSAARASSSDRSLATRNGTQLADSIQVSTDGESWFDSLVLKFDSRSNWTDAQSVYIHAVDDNSMEGLRNVVINHSIQSSNPDFNGLDINNLEVNVFDNDRADLTVLESGTNTRVVEGASVSGSGWDTPIDIVVVASAVVSTVAPSQPVQKFGAQSHLLDKIHGPLIIEGSVPVGKDRSLVRAVIFPSEGDTELDVPDLSFDESLQTDTLNVFSDGSVIAQSGVLTDSNISGLGMGSDLDVDLGKNIFTVPGGISYQDVEIVDVRLGSADDTFIVESTSDGVLTIVHGGGGADELTVTGGGGVNAPLVLFGDTSQNGLQYNSTTAALTGNGRKFETHGDDIIDASAATGSVVIYGGRGKDLLTGSAFDDHIAGGSGDDTIYALGGSDHVYGDSGFNVDLSQRLSLSSQVLLVVDNGSTGDHLPTADDLAGPGSDKINVGLGNDFVIADFGVIEQVAGTNRILKTTQVIEVRSNRTGEGANDIITFDGGNNVIIGGFGADIINSGSGHGIVVGDNTVLGDNGFVILSNGTRQRVESTDITEATGGADLISLGAGSDQVIAGVGADKVKNNSGETVIVGDNGFILSDANGRYIQVLAVGTVLGGGDTITGGMDRDVVLAGVGADFVDGGDGNNIAIGDGGEVTRTEARLQVQTTDLFLGANDILIGGSGNDYLLGGFGHDTFVGNFAEDVMVGEYGRFTFIIDQPTQEEHAEFVVTLAQGYLDLIRFTHIDLYNGLLAEKVDVEEPGLGHKLDVQYGNTLLTGVKDLPASVKAALGRLPEKHFNHTEHKPLTTAQLEELERLLEQRESQIEQEPQQELKKSKNRGVIRDAPQYSAPVAGVQAFEELVNFDLDALTRLELQLQAQRSSQFQSWDEFTKG
jgi:hypothetical protein